MNKEEFIKLSKEGEGSQIEYKTCSDKVSESLYETVCSFLNHSGGKILIGVKDNGEIIGVNPQKVERIKNRYRFEALFHMCTYDEYNNKKKFPNRYDDRKTMRSNLIQVYEQLTLFTERYLPNKFYLPPGTTRREDLRWDLFRENVPRKH